MCARNTGRSVLGVPRPTLAQSMLGRALRQVMPVTITPNQLLMRLIVLGIVPGGGKLRLKYALRQSVEKK